MGEPRTGALTHLGPVWSVAFSPDGTTVLTGSADKTARLWDRDTARATGPVFTHPGPVRCVAFSPNGKRIVIGAANGVSRVWDLATHTPVGALPVHDGHVLGIAFAESGKEVFTCGEDKTVRRYALRAPIEGEVRRVVLWTKLVTGLELDPVGGTTGLSAEKWQAYRQELADSGGAPE